MRVPFWELPLNGPPAIPFAGTGCHGRSPRSDKYCLPDVWCVHLYKYYGTLVINGSPFRIEPGMVSVIPPLVHFEHRWERYPSVHVFAWFAPARNTIDKKTSERTVSVPALQSLGHEWEVYADWFENSIEKIWTAQPPRAEAFVWNLLWRLVPTRTELTLSGPVNPSVARVMQLIEVRMDNPLRMKDLAAVAGLSPSQLGRVFQQEQGITPMRYLRRRRVERARQLLTRTALPVKQVASIVGIGDLQLFNKMLRRDLGKAPRRVRRESKGRRRR